MRTSTIIALSVAAASAAIAPSVAVLVSDRTSLARRDLETFFCSEEVDLDDLLVRRGAPGTRPASVVVKGGVKVPWLKPTPVAEPKPNEHLINGRKFANEFLTRRGAPGTRPRPVVPAVKNGVKIPWKKPTPVLQPKPNEHSVYGRDFADMEELVAREIALDLITRSLSGLD